MQIELIKSGTGGNQIVRQTKRGIKAILGNWFSPEVKARNPI
jgi:hypothetical protein